jgi:hypothetical protein
MGIWDLISFTLQYAIQTIVFIMGVRSPLTFKGIIIFTIFYVLALYNYIKFHKSTR